MNRLWKVGLALIATLALAGAAVGFVAAQSDGEPTPEATPKAMEDGGRHGVFSEFVPRLAENLGITQEAFEAAAQETQLALVDEALANGDIDEETAVRLREAIESGERSFFGKGGRGGHQRGGGNHLEVVSELIGIPAEEISAALADGQNLAQVAEANGVSADELSAALLARVAECVAERVEEGKIDQAQADEKLASAEERFAEMINQEGGPDKGSHGGGHRGRFGPRDNQPATDPETTGLTF